MRRLARLVDGKDEKMQKALHATDANPLRNTVAPKNTGPTKPWRMFP